MTTVDKDATSGNSHCQLKGSILGTAKRIFKKTSGFIQMAKQFFSALLTTSALLIFLPISNAADVTPTDVFSEVAKLNQQIDQVRFHMGAPKVAPLNLKIRNAQPHDVYFLARTLHQKSSRLLFQVNRKTASIPDTSSEVYLPADVLKLVIAARANVSRVMETLEIGADEGELKKRVFSNKQPSDVFISILAVNRQINTLLNRRFAPSDVFEEVTLAIGYGAILLGQYQNIERIPEPPSVAPGRIPSDVFFRLLEGLEKIKQLYGEEGLDSLSVDAQDTSSEKITPSDVTDIASLLVARLDFLHKHKSLQRLPREPYYPGTVYPTDVYRQVGILLIQLDSLLEHSRKS
jgi:cell division protein FtsL